MRTPKFPIGVQDATFQYTELVLAGDGSKLFKALRPVFNGITKEWFIVGMIGDPINVRDQLCY